MDNQEILDIEAEDLSVESENSEPELTEEQKASQEKFFRSMLISRFSSVLRAIHDLSISKNKSLAELQQEVREKKSTLSANQREFLMSFDIDFIQQLLDDMYNINKNN